MNEESVFDKDIETTFDTADIVFAINGVRREIQYLAVTVAFATGVLIYLASKR